MIIKRFRKSGPVGNATGIGRERAGAATELIERDRNQGDDDDRHAKPHALVCQTRTHFFSNGKLAAPNAARYRGL
jgi:hypothetical protein